MAKTRSYNGYSLFDDVGNINTRTWNRCAITFNLNSIDVEQASGYLNCFTDQERKEITAMIKYINTVGYDKARIAVFGKLKAVGGVH